MSDEKNPKDTITFDEAMALISDIARNGEGPDKFRALKVAMSQQSGGITLPDPMSADEVVERLSRLMRGVGPANCQWAYRKAFPAAKKEIFESKVMVRNSDLNAEDIKKLPKSLKQLYKQFPETKRSGQPPGYPTRGGLEAQVQWCQEKAIEILRTRKQAIIDNVAIDAARKQEPTADD